MHSGQASGMDADAAGIDVVTAVAIAVEELDAPEPQQQLFCSGFVPGVMKGHEPSLLQIHFGQKRQCTLGLGFASAFGFAAALALPSPFLFHLESAFGFGSCPSEPSPWSYTSGLALPWPLALALLQQQQWQWNPFDP